VLRHARKRKHTSGSSNLDDYDVMSGDLANEAISVAPNVIVSVTGHATSPRGIIVGDGRSADANVVASSGVIEGGGSVARHHRTTHAQTGRAVPFDAEPGESVIGGYGVVGGPQDKTVGIARQDDAVETIFVDLDGENVTRAPFTTKLGFGTTEMP